MFNSTPIGRVLHYCNSPLLGFCLYFLKSNYYLNPRFNKLFLLPRTQLLFCVTLTFENIFILYQGLCFCGISVFNIQILFYILHFLWNIFIFYNLFWQLSLLFYFVAFIFYYHGFMDTPHRFIILYLNILLQINSVCIVYICTCEFSMQLQPTENETYLNTIRPVLNIWKHIAFPKQQRIAMTYIRLTSYYMLKVI
jgi:hypothetical protein